MHSTFTANPTLLTSAVATLGTYQLQYCVHIWVTQFKKDISKLEHVQDRHKSKQKKQKNKNKIKAEGSNLYFHISTTLSVKNRWLRI